MTVPLRFSRLKNIATSPLHYLHSLTVETDSPAMRLGRLCHHHTLGATPDTSKPVVIFDGGARRGKSWDAFKAKHEGADIFLASEDAKARAVAEAIRGNELAYDLVGPHRNAKREMTLHWEFCGRKCSGTPDLFSPEVLIDVKTTQSADPRRWLGRFGEIRKRAYGAQLAWYLDAIIASGHQRPERVCIVAAETKAPFPVTVFELDETEIEAGRAVYRSWLELALVCESSRSFPAYSQTVVRVVAEDDDEMPDLVFGDEDEAEESEAA